MAAANGNGVLNECYLVCDGKKIAVPDKIFEVFRMFIEERKQGSVVIQFISGGIRGVKTENIVL